jgi:hypothetical protein
MVYGCGCAVVGKPNRFTTPTEMRFFCLPLSTMNCNGEPFTHILEWKRRSASSGYSGSSFWIFVVATVALSMHLIQKPSTQLLVTAWPDTHLCCGWSSYGTHTTSPCPFLASWCCSLLVALAGCPRLPRLGLVLCFAVWEYLSRASDL